MAGYKHTPAKIITLGAMVTALSVLSLFAASVFVAWRMPLVLFASVLTCILTCEGAYAAALIAYVATAALAFFVSPDKTMSVVFALLPGHYGIFRSVLHAHMRGRILRSLIKLLYCDACAALMLYLALTVFSMQLSPPWDLPAWLFVLIMQAAFIMYDLFYGAAAAVYENRFRRLLVSRR